jgi:hypothetical protein
MLAVMMSAPDAKKPYSTALGPTGEVNEDFMYHA